MKPAARWVLGVTTMDNAAAALLRNGRVVAAVEEERFSRRKHHRGFPSRAVQYCLDEGGIAPEELSAVALSWKPWVIRRRGFLIVRQLLRPSTFRAKLRRSEGLLPDYWMMLRLKAAFERHAGWRWPAHVALDYHEHHLSHAASAYFASPFEDAAFLTYDGTGEDTCTMLGTVHAGSFTVRRRMYLPHSLGQLYAAVTAFLGFKPNSEEGKVMALASYGDPRTFRPLFDDVVRTRDGSYAIASAVFDYHRALLGEFGEETHRRCGPPRVPGADITDRDRDLAAGLQEALERAGLEAARWLHRRTGLTDACLAGGVALNSVLSQRLLTDAGFRRVFIQPAAHDGGSALGAAYLSAWRRERFEREAWTHAFWGPSHDDAACERALRAAGVPHEHCGEGVVDRTARALARGRVVAWFQDRGEFGPRALGARSILADPTDPRMPDQLNRRVKHREPFRPFAPACLEEEAADWFDVDGPSRFMLRVVPVRPERRARVPAITHVDGTARLQTVPQEPPTRFRAMIEAFRDLRGVPMVLNTSFNVQGEPIVGTPEEALRTYLGTDLDALALGGYFVEKKGSAGNTAP